MGETRRFLTDAPKEYVVFDTETTGLAALISDVIQFSALRVRDGEIIEEFDTYINPGYHIAEDVTAINGITDETVKNAPDANTAAKLIKAFVGESPVLVGYNSVRFDEPFVNKVLGSINESLNPSAHYDVLKMARESGLSTKHKLIDMATLAGVADKYSFHSSIDDAKATYDVLKYIVANYHETPAESLTITNVKHWKKSALLNRVYVSNSKNISIYYDVFYKDWVIPETVDAEQVKRDVYARLGVSNDAEMVAYFE